MSSFTLRPPAPSERLPVRQKLGWAAGSVADNLLMNGLNLLAMPIYNIALGVNAVWLGYALAIPRVFDTIIDPFIGNYSDNLQTRWGRRRPLIVIGAVIMALFYSLIWMPPSFLGHNGLLVYFLISCFLMYIGYGIFVIPYMALGFELTNDYHERTRVQAWRMGFAYAGGLLMPWLYKLTLLPVFGRNEVVGARYVGPFIAMIGLMSCLMPAIFCREKAQTVKQPEIKLLPAFKYTLSNRPFLLLVGSIFFVMLGINVTAPFLVYLNIYYVCGGDKDFASTLTGWGGTLQGLCGLLSAPLITMLATRFGKKKIIIWGLLLSIFGYFLYWFLITPKHPYLQIIPAFFVYPGLACVWLLVGSLVADICDDDELRTGMRREGMFGAVMMTIAKAAVALVTVVTGYLLMFSGYSEGAVQTPQTLLVMRILYVAGPVFLIACALIFMTIFPLDEARARSIRAALDQKKEEPQSEATLSNDVECEAVL